MYFSANVSFTPLYALLLLCSTRVLISNSDLWLRLSMTRLSLCELRLQIEDTQRVTQGVTGSSAGVLNPGALPPKSNLRLQQRHSLNSFQCQISKNAKYIQGNESLATDLTRMGIS